MNEEISLERAFELTEEKLEIIIEEDGFHEAQHKLNQHDRLYEMRAYCPFCEMHKGIFDSWGCRQCEVREICHGSYKEENYEKALEELRELKEEMLGDEKE